MIPELGHFALILAFCVSVLQCAVPLIGASKLNYNLMSIAAPAARLQFGFIALAFACLTWSFIENDFSVALVASHSNSLLPLHYRISAVWGNHEGSLLLWVLMLSGWGFAISHFSRSLPLPTSARVLATMGMISIGFLLFMLLTSNPFERLFPAAADGNDLNPLLQDIGLILHPPMLYMGYVGMAVPFAFAIAALLEGRIDAAWLRWTRPWTLAAWVFLTIGITLGSWWAYYELGWGGWWFWDPVENASFMPWLLCTALIHSLAVTEQRNTFKAWTLLLAIFGFSLSLLGTFLVRSGVLVSVHAFATDPERGLFILAFLAFVVGGALTLYAWRATTVVSVGRFSGLSRESLLLINNILLMVACASVLFGTLYPIIYDWVLGKKLSVGAQYFNKVFVPLMLILACVLCLGPLTRWRRDTFSELTIRVYKTLIGSALLGVAFLLLTFGPASIGITIAIVIAFWVISASFTTLKNRVAGNNWQTALLRLPRSFVGMLVAHFGLGIFIIGATMVSHYEETANVRLAPGESHTMGDYTFKLVKIASVNGPNYKAERGTVEVFKDNSQVTTLYPEKRLYHSGSNPMTEAGIDAGFLRDVYVSLGEPLDKGAWAIRLNYKPFVRWLWLGPLFMSLGGILAASDRRYRRKRSAKPVTATATHSQTA